jgi:hypothetical protein
MNYEQNFMYPSNYPEQANQFNLEISHQNISIFSMILIKVMFFFVNRRKIRNKFTKSYLDDASPIGELSPYFVSFL